MDVQHADAEAILRHSLEAGNVVDELYVELSRNAGYPFYAETEKEWDDFQDAKSSPFLGYPVAVANALFSYQHAGLYNKNILKMKWLLDVVRRRAAKGDFECQGILMSCSSHLDPRFAFAYREVFRKGLEQAALEGDASALYAQALFLERFDSFERFELLVLAGRRGSSDAYREAKGTLSSFWHSLTGDFPSWEELVVYDKLAAEAQGGVFKADAQYDLGSAYLGGEGDLVASREKALRWLRPAAASGLERARSVLGMLEAGKLTVREGLTHGVRQLSPEAVAARIRLGGSTSEEEERWTLS